jgi:hypothetical protein
MRGKQITAPNELCEVAERRPIIAHSETVGCSCERKFKPRQGRQKMNGRFYSVAPAGAWLVCGLTHGFTVGYYLPRLRRFRKKISLDAAKVKV